MTRNITTGTFISDLSNHFINFIATNPPSNIGHHPSKTYREINQANIDRFRTQLRNLSWNNVYSTLDVNEGVEKFWDDFKTLFDLNFPIKTVRINKNHHKVNNFMTNGLLISRTTKIKLHKIALANPDPRNISAYKTFRNLYNTVLRCSKKLYFENNLNTHAKKPKKTWELLKEAIKTNNTNPKINSITVNGQNITNKTVMANEFNNFFTTAGMRISETVNPTYSTSLNPDDFIPPNPNPPQLELGAISPAVIVSTIQSFISKSSTDIDGLSTKILKSIAVEISQPLSHIFSLSISTGVFPNKFKVSRTVPIFKAGNSELCDNYRPISLLSSLSKILEKLIAVQLTNHLELNNLLYKHQYGFQRNKINTP